MAPPRSPASRKTRPAQRPPRQRLLKWLAILLISLPLLGLLGLLLASESYSARWQSQVFSELAARMSFRLENGPSPAISWPAGGPFDQRLGYSRLPDLITRLQNNGYHISQQARQSQSMLDFAAAGFYPPYQEKNRSGLTIRDCQQTPMYRFLQPQRSFSTFASIPPVMVQSLLFIENRDLLDTRRPWLNPAVNWPRFLHAAWSQLASRLADDIDSAGGSTLATQIEKFRHSPDGLTTGIGEKFRQMVSASLRAYSQGRETLPARQKLVLDYLNNVPLAAARGYGEIHGIGDALWVWFGADFHSTLQALEAAPGSSLADQAMALRQVLALMIAQRRPSWYLLNGRADLEQLTDSHLRLLGESGIISLPLRDQALASRLRFRDLENDPAVQPQVLDKGVIQSRNRLVSQLGLSLYDTDRLDLAVRSTLNAPLQRAVTEHLSSLSDPANASRHGLIGHRLLSAEQTPHISYSFTLFERGSDGNRVRVQTDTTSQLFSINDASKLELGSTAKLRVLATYLEVIAELYRRHAGGDGNPLGSRQFNSEDNLSRWVIEYLQGNPGASLEQTLSAALDRRYSASPGESFFTGGGIHTFGNFRKEDNGRRPTLHEALRESINLPFVRLLRDLVQYSTYQATDYQAHLLHDDRDPRRLEYLRRFADREGSDFLGRFWRKYREKQGEAMLDTLLEGLKPGSVRLAAIHRYLLPEASQEQFNRFMYERMGNATPPAAQLASLYRQYGRDSYSLSDLGWIARVHPLEMWLVGYRLQHPDASFQQAVAASSNQRVEIYDWLFKTPNRRARDTRIRSMLEVEAFLDIHQRWNRLGFPFSHLVPSLATALGSSGDRPAALAELMGIILNDGRRLPTLHSEQFSFAVGTPYETRLTPLALTGEQVMEPAVARALRALLTEVVEQGTARRVAGSFSDSSGQPLSIGGKTGTGDNRSETVRGGRVIQSQVRNRTATFVFYLGNRHFGTLTAYVDGEGADGMGFTSALPVQVLRSMAPLLQDYLNDPAACQLQAAAAETEQP